MVISKKIKTQFTCQTCGYSTSKWIGKCPDCNEWNTFIEEEQSKSSTTVFENSLKNKSSIPKTISDIQSIKQDRILTGISEFDRVVGNGLVSGSLILVGGEPGIGKSTLMMEISGKLANLNQDFIVLYISGEESAEQVASRSKRLGITSKNMLICHESNWQNILEHIKKFKPTFLIIDSIQTIYTGEIASPPGTVSQIRDVTYELMNQAKGFNITTFIIGHVTKEGNIAGPKILEHMVDTVVYFEGDQFGQYRLLRAIKNRFGNTNEVGIFEMHEVGLKEVSNPSLYFLDENLENNYGRSISCIVEGSRPLFIELQALVVENKYGTGRRTTQGIDTNRLAMLIAIIEKYFGIPISFNDIYVNVVGGIKLLTRETDLGIIAAILSSLKNKPIDNSIVFLGEVGLTGEVRSVPMVEIRIKEIVQMKFQKIVTSERTAKEYAGKYKINIVGIKKASQLEQVIDI
ncbi:MAG: DNA repair protein RadA [Bacteriovoracaceae bacterium]